MKKEEFFLNIKKDCFALIFSKKVNISELAFLLGIEVKNFYSNFTECISDLSFYLKTYDLLLNWEN